MATIALGADHAGFLLKEDVKAWLASRGYVVEDAGTFSAYESCDYPDFAGVVAQAVAAGRAEFGVLVCGTGVGMAIAANKIPGIRAAVCGDVATARLSREHNDANVLALGARVIEPRAALAVTDAWLQAGFLGGRHARRVDKLAALERAGEYRHAPAD
jgi:ribose 5-phosphate isomerase B